MPQTYTTTDLVDILARERRACLTGQRLKLPVQPSGNSPIDKFLQNDGYRRFSAYEDFKAAIHAYQREERVSGSIWQEIEIASKRLRFPTIADGLIATEGDLGILAAERDRVVEFWLAATIALDYYRSYRNGRDYRPTSIEAIKGIWDNSRWANIWKIERADFREIVLQLGWGQPSDAAYARDYPHAGSDYFHAVTPGSRPIGG
jgi:hypothetical protein